MLKTFDKKFEKIKLIAITMIFLNTSLLLGHCDAYPADAIDSEEEAWSFTYSDKLISQPVILENMIVSQTKSKIYANDLTTGRKIWAVELQTSDDELYSSSGGMPIAFNKSVIALLVERNTIALVNATNGKVSWISSETRATESSFYSGSLIMDMNIVGDQVLSSRLNTSLAAYDITNGDLNWEVSVPERTRLFVLQDSETVYLATVDTITMYDKTNGSRILEKNLSGSARKFAKDENYVYIAFKEGECSFAALDVETLENIWCTAPSKVGFFSPEVFINMDKKNVYFASGNLIAFSKNNGEIVWALDIDNQATSLSLTPMSHLYITNADELVKINIEDGKKIASMILPRVESLLKTDKLFDCLPLVHGDLIYQCDESSLTAFNNPLVTGAEE